jgi:hypothetical protein
MADSDIKNTLAVENSAIKQPAFNFFSHGLLPTGLSGFKNNLIGLFKDGKSQLNIRIINAVLAVIILILGVYIMNIFFGSLSKTNNPEFKPPSSANQTDDIIKINSRLKDVSYYVTRIKDRDIFRMGPKIEDTPAEVISAKAAEATKNFKLVGISWSDNPDAIIEDTKNGQTFFVKKGQVIDEMVVESIAKEKVVLRYNQELIEVR